MANCTPGECENDPKYTTPVKLQPYPGGSEGGHEFVTELPETGATGVEYIVLTDIADCETFEGSFAWNAEAECWVQTSGSGGGGGGATYSFSETDTGWQAKKNGTVIFTYVDKDTVDEYRETAKGFEVLRNGSVIFSHDEKGAEYIIKDFINEDTGKKGWVLQKDGTPIYTHYDTEPNEYVFEQTSTGWRVKENGTVKFTYTDQDEDTKYSIEATTDGWVFKEDGATKFTYTEPLGDPSDGTYYTSGSLTETITGQTIIPIATVTGLNINDIVINETLVFDGSGTVGRIVAVDATNARITVETITTSPGERRGTRLGAVDDSPDLPTTVAAALALNWQTPLAGDFAYVREDSAYGDHLTEYVIQSVDAAGNIVWGYSHTLNAGNYLTGVNYHDGTPIPVNADGTVTLPADQDTTYDFENIVTDGKVTGWRVKEHDTSTVVYTYTDQDDDTTYTFTNTTAGWKATNDKTGVSFFHSDMTTLVDGEHLYNRGKRYFVDADNGDDTNDGSFEHPYRTLQMAVNQAAPYYFYLPDLPGAWTAGGTTVFVNTKATKIYEPVYVTGKRLAIHSYDAAASTGDTVSDGLVIDSDTATLKITTNRYERPDHPGAYIYPNAWGQQYSYVDMYIANLVFSNGANTPVTCMYVGMYSYFAHGSDVDQTNGVKYTLTINANVTGDQYIWTSDATVKYGGYVRTATGVGSEGLGCHTHSRVFLRGNVTANTNSKVTISASNWAMAASDHSEIQIRSHVTAYGGYATANNCGAMYAAQCSNIILEATGASATAQCNFDLRTMNANGTNGVIVAYDGGNIRLGNTYGHIYIRKQATNTAVSSCVYAYDGAHIQLRAYNYMHIENMQPTGRAVCAARAGGVELYYGGGNAGTFNVYAQTSGSASGEALACWEQGMINVNGGSGTARPVIHGRIGYGAYTGGKLTYTAIGAWSGTTQRTATGGGRIYTGNQSSVGAY